MIFISRSEKNALVASRITNIEIIHPKISNSRKITNSKNPSTYPPCMIQIFNTLSREKESFKPLKQEVVKIYSCGPTPYNFAHIGNMRAYLFEDLVIRTIEYAGYKTQTVMNITDIDDKTIRDSQANNISRDELTQKYTQAFLKDLDLLNIHRAHDIVPISTLVDEMVIMIQ